MDDSEDLLPEDDSVFEGLINDSMDISSDAMFEDSFSSLPETGLVSPLKTVATSTPVVAVRTRASCMSTRSQSRARPSTPTSQPDPSSPSMSTRSRSRTTPSTPTSQPDPSSPSMSTRSRSRTRPSTPTSQPDPSSPSMSTRSRSRTTPSTPTSQPDPSSPSMFTRSRSRTRPSAPSNQPAPSSSSTIQPNPPIRPIASRIKCTECPTTCANDRTFKVYKKMHLLKRVFSKVAKPEAFMENLPVLVTKTLLAMHQEKFTGKYANDIKQYSKNLKTSFECPEEDHELLLNFLHEHLYGILTTHSSAFSSSLVFTFHVGVNRLLNNAEFKMDLKKFILPLGEQPASLQVLEIFIGNFMLVLSNEVLIYFIRTIHGACESDVIRRKRSGDSTSSTTFLEMVYYIGGSVVSGLIFKGSKYKESNPKWQIFVEVLQSRFLRVEGVGNACSEDVSKFTKSVDRGKLKHLSQEAFDFFVVLFDYLMSLEGDDGTLPPNVIENYVLEESSLLCLWDVVVGTHLEDDVSLDFLMQTSNTCKLIVMKGIMKRQLNEHLKTAFASVSLRSRLSD